jgi:MoxR-like ATPase
MNNTDNYTFYGDQKHHPAERHPDAPQQPEPYIATPELAQAVNLAFFLNRPLLLEGEAGCGKTRLAHAVAYELGLPLYRWDIRSTSKAQEGLYYYDALLRLHDVQLQRFQETSSSAPLQADRMLRNPSEPTHYRKFGAIGKAFQLKECPAVVLIDEIDKGDIDFPNDLLTVLDEPWGFEIPETGEMGDKKITALYPPLVIITSNAEKGNLPTPFLRRCIYYFLAFPEEKDFQTIVAAHYPVADETAPAQNLVNTAIARFFELREKLLRKQPSTSEFLDWLKALHHFKLIPTDDLVPYPGLLFKMRDDWLQYVEV